MQRIELFVLSIQYQFHTYYYLNYNFSETFQHSKTTDTQTICNLLTERILN